MNYWKALFDRSINDFIAIAVEFSSINVVVVKGFQRYIIPIFLTILSESFSHIE